MDFLGPSFPFIFNFSQDKIIPFEEYIFPDSSVHENKNCLDSLFTNPINQSILPFSKNLLVSHSCPLAQPRQDVFKEFAGARLPEMWHRIKNALLDLRSEKKVKIVLIDNTPGFYAFSLLSCGLARSSGGMSVFVSSADVQDIGGLQIDMDLFRSQGIGTKTNDHFMWVINKLEPEFHDYYRSVTI